MDPGSGPDPLMTAMLSFLFIDLYFQSVHSLLCVITLLVVGILISFSNLKHY